MKKFSIKGGILLVAFTAVSYGVTQNNNNDHFDANDSTASNVTSNNSVLMTQRNGALTEDPILVASRNTNPTRAYPWQLASKPQGNQTFAPSSPAN